MPLPLPRRVGLASSLTRKVAWDLTGRRLHVVHNVHVPCQCLPPDPGLLAAGLIQASGLWTLS